MAAGIRPQVLDPFVEVHRGRAHGHRAEAASTQGPVSHPIECAVARPSHDQAGPLLIGVTRFDPTQG